MHAFYRNLARMFARLSRSDPLEGHLRRGLVVGKRFRMLEDVVLDYSHTWLIEIGDDVTLAPQVYILAHDASMKHHLDTTRIGPVRIGNRVFVGARSLILPGVTIGDDVVIGAGSVVARDVPDNQVVAGNPARRICDTDAYIERRRQEMSRVPVFPYEEYSMEHGITSDKKREMIERLGGGFGYID